jgi:hypothetical protein
MVKEYQAERGREFWISYEMLATAAKRFETEIDWRKVDSEISSDWKLRRDYDAKRTS